MSNFRIPAKAARSTLLRRLSYSTTSSENTAQGVEDKEEDKIKSEKFRALLPYLKQRNSETTPLTAVEKQQIFTNAGDGQEQPASQLTNIFDTTPEIPKDNSTPTINTLAEEPPPQDNSRVGETQQHPSAENHKVEQVVIPLQILESLPKPQSLQVLMVSEAKSPVVDLSSALVPLSLHLRDKNILVDAVVQDVKQAYSTALVKLDRWYLEAQAHGREMYIVAEHYIRQPAPLQNILKERALQLYNERSSKNAIALQEPKLLSLVNIEVNNVAEKIKSAFENVIENIRSVLKDKVSKREEKREENPEKKEEKPPGK